MKILIQTAVQIVFGFYLLILIMPEIMKNDLFILYFVLSFVVSLIIRNILK